VQLNYYRDSWGLDVSECSCDVHFLEYLAQHGVADKAIFHFGTGAHHVVGLENAKAARPNHVLGVTASREEYDAYVDLVIADPRLAVTYKAMFVDIYTLDSRTLPDFDLVTLFHLGEFYGADQARYAPLDDRGLLAMFIAKLAPGGRICFYRGSNGWAASTPIVEAFVAEGKLAVEEEFLSLLVCRGRDPGPIGIRNLSTGGTERAAQSPLQGRALRPTRGKGSST
jgi:hypothetical protein